MGEILCANDVPAQYYAGIITQRRTSCCQSNGQAVSQKYLNQSIQAAIGISGYTKNKHFQFQHSHWTGRWRTGPYLHEFVDIKKVTLIIGKTGIKNEDYFRTMSLHRQGFAVIPDNLNILVQQQTVVAEGRRSHDWLCCQQRHVVRTCSKKAPLPKEYTTPATTLIPGSTKRSITVPDEGVVRSNENWTQSHFCLSHFWLSKEEKHPKQIRLAPKAHRQIHRLAERIKIPKIKPGGMTAGQKNNKAYSGVEGEIFC